MPKGKSKNTPRKATDDEKVSIFIDPAIVAEMEAEARKSPEQQEKERDEFMNILFSKGMGLMESMKPQKPIKKPITPVSTEPQLDPDDLELF